MIFVFLKKSVAVGATEIWSRLLWAIDKRKSFAVNDAATSAIDMADLAQVDFDGSMRVLRLRSAAR